MAIEKASTGRTFRIYLVQRSDTKQERLVRAPTPIAAERHVINPTLVTSRVATQEDMVRLLSMKDGSGIENARYATTDEEAAS